MKTETTAGCASIAMPSRLLELGLGIGTSYHNDDNLDDLAAGIATLAILDTVIVSMSKSQQKKPPTTTSDEDIHRETGPALTRAYCSWLLVAPDTMFRDLFRMTKPVFRSLCQWLRHHTTLRDTRHHDVEQKVMVFLWMVAFNEPQRNTAYRFKMAQSTVSSIFRQVIIPMRYLHTRFVRLPGPTYVSPDVELDLKFMQFNGAIGAIDGTHIHAFVPAKKQKRFWSRKNNISQNVLAAVTFSGLFSYVLAGAEGSINDASLIREAHTRSFTIPDGRFYLGDAGFGSRKGLIIPYPHVYYHLRDWDDIGRLPATPKELFNKRHAQLRTVVEHVFGRCKRKFKIIRSSAPEYCFEDQVRIVYAVTGLYNFIQLEGKEPDGTEEEEGLTDWDFEALAAARERADRVISGQTGIHIRDMVSQWVWDAFDEYLKRKARRAAREG